MTGLSSSYDGFHCAFLVIARFFKIVNPMMHSRVLTRAKWTWWRVMFGLSAGRLLDTGTIRLIGECISTVAGGSSVFASSTIAAALCIANCGNFATNSSGTVARFSKSF